MAKLADASDLGSDAERHESSNLSIRTTFGVSINMANTDQDLVEDPQPVEITPVVIKKTKTPEPQKEPEVVETKSQSQIEFETWWRREQM